VTAPQSSAAPASETRQGGLCPLVASVAHGTLGVQTSPHGARRQGRASPRDCSLVAGSRPTAMTQHVPGIPGKVISVDGLENTVTSLAYSGRCALMWWRAGGARRLRVNHVARHPSHPEEEVAETLKLSRSWAAGDDQDLLAAICAPSSGPPGEQEVTSGWRAQVPRFLPAVS